MTMIPMGTRPAPRHWRLIGGRPVRNRNSEPVAGLEVELAVDRVGGTVGGGAAVAAAVGGGGGGGGGTIGGGGGSVAIIQ